MEELNNHETPETVDFGEILYEKSNAKSALDAPTGKIGAKGWVTRIYMILLGAGMFGWFLYSLINTALHPPEGDSMAILEYFLTFVVLVIAELILLLSAFGGWGKFTRMALRHKGLTRQHGIEGVETRQLQAELAAADANKAQENAVRIYNDCIVVSNVGFKKVIHRSQLQRVKCDPQPKGYQLTFLLYDSTEIVANQLIPLSDLPLVKKHFDNFDYAPARREKGYLKDKLSALVIAFVPILIGIGAILLHYLVFDDMPLFFGIFFAAVGIIVAIGQFGDVPIVQHGVMPILFGALFTAIPIGVALTIADLSEAITITTMLTTFTPIHAVLSLFFGLGPMMIIVGIAGIINCARM